MSYTQTAGVSFTVTVTAYDSLGNVVTTDSSTSVTMTSSSGTLLFDGNGNGIFGEAGHADYAAAKAAMLGGLLPSLKNEAARLGVRVNAVAPGWTLTPMIGPKGIDDALLARVTATMALKKIARPEDVAAQVVVLASDSISGHVTGQVVVVAGGMEGRIVS